MPHNLYRTYTVSPNSSDRSRNNEDVAEAVRFLSLDSNIQLSAAFVILTHYFFDHGVAVFKAVP